MRANFPHKGYSQPTPSPSRSNFDWKPGSPAQAGDQIDAQAKRECHVARLAVMRRDAAENARSWKRCFDPALKAGRR